MVDNVLSMQRLLTIEHYPALSHRHTYPSSVGELMNLARVVSCQQRLGDRIFPSTLSKTLFSSFVYSFAVLPLMDRVGDIAKRQQQYIGIHHAHMSAHKHPHKLTNLHCTHAQQTHTRTYIHPLDIPSYVRFVRDSHLSAISAMRAAPRVKLSAFFFTALFAILLVGSLPMVCFFGAQLRG